MEKLIENPAIELEIKSFLIGLNFKLNTSGTDYLTTLIALKYVHQTERTTTDTIYFEKLREIYDLKSVSSLERCMRYAIIKAYEASPRHHFKKTLSGLYPTDTDYPPTIKELVNYIIYVLREKHFVAHAQVVSIN